MIKIKWEREGSAEDKEDKCGWKLMSIKLSSHHYCLNPFN